MLPAKLLCALGAAAATNAECEPQGRGWRGSRWRRSRLKCTASEKGKEKQKGRPDDQPSNLHELPFLYWAPRTAFRGQQGEQELARRHCPWSSLGACIQKAVPPFISTFDHQQQEAERALERFTPSRLARFATLRPVAERRSRSPADGGAQTTVQTSSAAVAASSHPGLSRLGDLCAPPRSPLRRLSGAVWVCVWPRGP